ncbi:hypothetical protein SAMN05216466_109250 [Paraburkholderia phenazinium]|jgi:hypothetical protein|uniref:Uncharacterized protein n=1 Tax=Paraburkholderia phenazinium TaxID=60549 RepID=A0A1G8C2Q2_9BURK|nr:hypothetical protein SAMN05216466_109250 [Paraburkholderia phenazinium]
MRSRSTRLSGVEVRTAAEIEGNRLFRIARWCCVALMATACAVILFDVMAFRPNVDRDDALTDQRASPQGEPSGSAGAKLPNDMLQSPSAPSSPLPDTEVFGMHKALNAGLLQDNHDQPDFGDWPNIKPVATDSD